MLGNTMMNAALRVVLRLLACVATAVCAAAPARADAEIRLADGTIWSGESGASVRVQYEAGGVPAVFDGVVETVDRKIVTVRGIDGSLLRLVDVGGGGGASGPASGVPTPDRPQASKSPSKSPSNAPSKAPSKAVAPKPTTSVPPAASRWMVVFEIDAVRGTGMGTQLVRPRVYDVPLYALVGGKLHGQIGTDVSAEVVDTLIKDLRRMRPDIVVFRMRNSDINRIAHLADDDPAEMGIPDPEVIRDMVKRLQEEVADARQVMWVEDAVGVSSLMALAWRELYLSSDARLGGVDHFIKQVEEMWSDPDVRSKMLAARLGLFTGLVVQGGHAECLAEAMLVPSKRLSLEFVGRTSRWRGDDKGSWIVDSSEEKPANFPASLAEESMLCDGLVDSLDDLMFLLGYREYERIDRGQRIVTEHITSWRRAMKEALNALEAAAETGEDVAGLGKRRALYEKVLAILRKHEFITNRAEFASRGINAEVIEYYIDDIRKTIQRINEAEKGSRQGGQRGGQGGGSGFGSPRG